MSRNNYQSRKVVIDGQNIAFWPCSKNSPKDWNLVISAAKFYFEKGASVVVFLPTHFYHRFDDTYRKLLRQYCVIQVVDCGDDKEMDDKLIVGYAKLMDCFYLSNDKKMCKHFQDNNLESRAWCERHRIEFSFDKQGLFVPKSDIFEKNEPSLNDSEVLV